MADQVEEVDLINRDPNGINSQLGVSLYYTKIKSVLSVFLIINCYANYLNY